MRNTAFYISSAPKQGSYLGRDSPIQISGAGEGGRILTEGFIGRIFLAGNFQRTCVLVPCLSLLVPYFEWKLELQASFLSPGLLLGGRGV